MRYKPDNVRGTYDQGRGYGYLVKLADGSEEFHRWVWQATARANGWTPPYQPTQVTPPRANGEENTEDKKARVDPGQSAV